MSRNAGSCYWRDYDGDAKESTNCRMEAQYAFQQHKDMVPLMLEEGYRAEGWLGMLLGVRLYYAFHGSVLASEAAFESKMEELGRELGERGKPPVPERLITLEPEADPPALAVPAALSLSAEAMSEVLRSGDADAQAALVAVLEHGLEVLDAVAISSPRRSRKRVDVVCDQLEEALEMVVVRFCHGSSHYLSALPIH